LENPITWNQYDQQENLQKIDASAEAEAYLLDVQRPKPISNLLAEIDEGFYIVEHYTNCNDFSKKESRATCRFPP